MNSYKRIADEYKLEFLETIRDEFQTDLKDPLLKTGAIDPWVYKQVNRIIDSPKLFYIEMNCGSIEKNMTGYMKS